METKPGVVEAEFPEELKFLFEPHDYKVVYGGRSGLKSWNFARALLILGTHKKLRILCTREVQKSIKDSVHKLLQDQIELLGLGGNYDVFETSIRGSNGTAFIFAGLSTQTVESIKSYEGVDIVWIEEAQIVAKKSWDILEPTIRKEKNKCNSCKHIWVSKMGEEFSFCPECESPEIIKESSEIWISFNPNLESDETYKRFVLNPPEDAVVKFLTFKDNPWHSEILEKRRLHCKQYDPEGYKNIWLGLCRPAVEGAIFYNEIAKAEAEGRICNVPYDPMLKVHLVPDLGWDDSLGVALVQKHSSEIRIIEYVEVSHTSLDVLSNELRTRPYNWGRVWLPPADGFSKTLNAKGKSTYDIMKALKWDCAKRKEVGEASVEEGLRISRIKFGQMYFDKRKCAASKSPKSTTTDFHPTERHWRLVESLKRFRRHISTTTDASGAPVRDLAKHGGDVLRYIALNADNMTNEDQRPMVFSGVSYRPRDAVVGI